MGDIYVCVRFSVDFVVVVVVVVVLTSSIKEGRNVTDIFLDSNVKLRATKPIPPTTLHKFDDLNVPEN